MNKKRYCRLDSLMDTAQYKENILIAGLNAESLKSIGKVFFNSTITDWNDIYLSESVDNRKIRAVYSRDELIYCVSDRDKDVDNVLVIDIDDDKEDVFKDFDLNTIKETFKNVQRCDNNEKAIKKAFDEIRIKEAMTKLNALNRVIDEKYSYDELKVALKSSFSMGRAVARYFIKAIVGIRGILPDEVISEKLNLDVDVIKHL